MVGLAVPMVPLVRAEPEVDDGYSAPTKLVVLLAVLRRLVPHLIEASLIPTALFLSTLALFGTVAAFVVALSWSYLALARRLVRRKPIPGILILATLGITMRTAIALASGSTFVYFFQPVLGTVVLGGVFLASIAAGQPLIARFAHDFCPLPAEVSARPGVRSLYRRLTYLWAAVNLAAAGTTLALLLTLPLPAYVAVRPIACWAITATGIVLTVSASVRVARLEGLHASVSSNGTLSARASTL